MSNTIIKNKVLKIRENKKAQIIIEFLFKLNNSLDFLI